MKKTLKMALGIAALGLLTAPANAVLSLRLSADNGVTWQTVEDGGPDDENATTGIVTFTGTVGVFDLTVNTATSKPVVGSDVAPRIQLGGLNVSSGPGTLIIQVSETDFLSASTGRRFTNSFSGTIPPNGTAVSTTYLDPDNTLFGIPPGSANAVALLTQPLPGDVSALATEGGDGPFSLTLETVFVHDGGYISSYSSDTYAPPFMTLDCPGVSGSVGAPYKSSLVASGGVPPYSFAITSGSLPPGLTLNPATGAISGTPTSGGTFPFTAAVVDSTGLTTGDHVAFVDCTIIIKAPPLKVSCPASSGKVGVPYNSSLLATDGVPPYKFKLIGGSLPPGLTLDMNTGAITGTPTAAGTFPYEVKVTDSSGATAKSVTIKCSITITTKIITLVRGDTATIGYWQNPNGQKLIKAMPNSPALGNWLAGNFPCMFGNLAGKSNKDVAAQFVTYFRVRGQKTQAQVMAGALAVYVTDSDLAGNVAAGYGFNVSTTGTGAKTYNVGNLGTTLGLSNHTSYTVMELLQAAEANCPFNASVYNALNTIFTEINEDGDRL